MMRKQIYAEIVCRINCLYSARQSFSSNNTNGTENTESIMKKRRFLRQSQGLHAFRPQDCAENPTIVLFPGQGSQFVGMAKSLVDIPEAVDMFEIASEILRFGLEYSNY